jgi:ABC-type lipoprotein export system ATPase subunit
LKDKNKVFLTNSEQHDFFQVFSDGQELSHGLNVVLGSRSTGKTFLLNKLQKIFNEDGNQVKYIKQFELVKVDEDEFNEMLEKERSDIRERHLSIFRAVVDDVVEIDKRTTNYKMYEYVESLIQFAKSEELQDEYSKAILFKEIPFSIRTDEDLKKIIKATKLLLEDKTYKTIIEKHISADNLDALLGDLKKQYKEKNKERIKKLWVNELVEAVAQKLQESSSSPNIKHNDTDFYEIKIEREKIRRFNAIAKAIKRDSIIDSKTFGDKFAIKARVDPFMGAQELRDESKTRDVRFSDAFKQYESPFIYLSELKKLSLEKTSLYRYFCKVRYHVLNEYDKPVSGGERSEFNLLKALQDARQFEMLLIDEPESSFDNVFLKDNVNKVIKEISKELPVVVVTHNNTVGMLMQPDYILYTSREVITGDDEYYLYSGSPGDTELKTADEIKKVSSHVVLLDTLEAGETAYTTRNQMYDNYKNNL